MAAALAAAGATVASADLANSELRTKNSELLPLDITDSASCSRVVDQVVSEHGSLEILVNCAAICLVDPMLEVTQERWDQVFAVNARGAFFLMQAAARAMILGGFGRIIQISTPAAHGAYPFFASYGASKAGVDSMVRAAAVELAPHGITVNAIMPGRMTGGIVDGIERDLPAFLGKSSEQLEAERTASLPMRRRAGPEEVAQAAVWLASDAAGYVTGERFNFTGGLELD